MYGTVAKLRVKPGQEEAFRQVMDDEPQDTPGFVFAHVFRLDDDPQNMMLVAAFDSRDTYRANAESPEQHEQYLRYRELLETEPEWHDGEIIQSITASATA